MKIPAARTFAGLMDEMSNRFGERNFATDFHRKLSYLEFRNEVRTLA